MRVHTHLFCRKNATLRGILSSAGSPTDAVRPSALQALLTLSGGTYANDPTLSRLSDGELTLAYVTLDLLHRTEPASAA